MTKANIDIVGRDFTGSAFDSVSQRVAGVNTGISVLKTSLIGLGSALSVGAFTNAIKSAADFQDQIAKMSQSTGLAVETLAGLEFAAGQNGTTLERTAKGVRAFSKIILEAEEGTGKYSKIIQALGLNLNDLKTATPEEQFIQLAGALRENVGEQERAAVVTSLLGDRYTELIPLLNQGEEGLRRMISEGRELNPITAESAARAEVFNDNLDKLGRTAGALGQLFFNSVSPALVEVTSRLEQSARSGTLLQDSLKNVALAATGFPAIKAAFDKIFGSANAADVAELNNELDKTPAALDDTGQAADGAGKQYRSFQSILDEVNDSLDKQATTTKKTATATKETAAAIKEEDEEARRLQADLREVARITRSVETADERLNREVAELNRLLASGQLSWDIYTRAIRKARSEIEELGEEFDENFSNLNVFAEQAGRNIQTAFGELFFDAFDGRLDEMGENFGRALKRMVAEALAADLLGAVFGKSKGFNNLGAIGQVLSGGGRRAGAGLGNLFGGISGLFGGGAANPVPGAISSVFSNGFIGGAGTAIGTTAAGGFGASMSSFLSTATPIIAATLLGDSIIRGLIGDLSTGSKILDSIPLIGSIGAGLFGRGPLKLKDSLIRGTVGAGGIGDDFLTASNFKAEGGLLRGDKVDRVIINATTGELVTGAPGLPESGISSKLDPFAQEASQQAREIGRLFDSTIQGFNNSIRQSADVLGIGTQALDGFNEWVQIASNGAKEITEQDIADTLTRLGDTMANTLLPGLVNMRKEGETSVQALNRMAGEFSALENALQVFGVSADVANQAVMNLSTSTRTALVDAVGGLDAFNASIGFFASNFLTLEEQADLAFGALDREMQKLGLSASMTREEFAALVKSVTAVGGASSELVARLLQLAPAFDNLKNIEGQLATQSASASTSVSGLAGSIGGLDSAAASTAQNVTAAFQRIDDARTAVTAAQNNLAVAQARAALNAAQVEQSAADQALAVAQSNLDAARGEEQRQQAESIRRVIDDRSRLISTYQSEAQALRSVADRFSSFADRIFDFRDSLALGNLSPFAPNEQLGIAEQDFERTLARALAGDEGAISRFPAVAETFLQASQRINGASQFFANDFNRVQSALDQVGSSARSQSDIARQQLAGIEGSITQLQRLNEEAQQISDGIGRVDGGIISVGQAMAELSSAQGRAAAAQGAVESATNAVEQALFVQNGFIDDVGMATIQVRDAVRELTMAVLQGFGNPNISDQQIRDFVAANPGMSAAELERVAVENGVSASQFSRATGIPMQQINAATQGRSVSDAEIARFVDEALARGDFMSIYNAARANGITSQRLANASVLTLEEINQFVAARGLQQFAQGTDFVQRSGLAMIHRGEAITPAHVPNRMVDELMELSKAIRAMIDDQNRQLSALLQTNMDSAKETARMIIDSNEKMAASSTWINRAIPKIA